MEQASSCAQQPTKKYMRGLVIKWESPSKFPASRISDGRLPGDRRGGRLQFVQLLQKRRHAHTLQSLGSWRRVTCIEIYLKWPFTSVPTVTWFLANEFLETVVLC